MGPNGTTLGHLEQAPFALLDQVMLARDPDTGQELLVAGAHDPLADRVEVLDSARLRRVLSDRSRDTHPTTPCRTGRSVWCGQLMAGSGATCMG